MGEAGQAQLVLGNHELNLLRRDRKHGNHWFWSETEQLCSRSSKATVPITFPDHPSFQVLGKICEQDDILDFLQRQPLVLERPGEVAVVHAMYDPKSVELLRSFDGDALEAFVHFSDKCKEHIEMFQHQEGREPTDDDKDMIFQNENPVAVLTSGMEVP